MTSCVREDVVIDVCVLNYHVFILPFSISNQANSQQEACETSESDTAANLPCVRHVFAVQPSLFPMVQELVKMAFGSHFAAAFQADLEAIVSKVLIVY